MKRLTDSFGHAIDGIIYCMKTQRNMRIHIAAAIMVMIASLFLRLSRTEIMILCLVIAFVIVCEMFNTAIEKAIDINIKEYNPLAKVSKDVAAGAVLVSAICSIVIGYLLFENKIKFIIKAISNILL